MMLYVKEPFLTSFQHPKSSLTKKKFERKKPKYQVR